MPLYMMGKVRHRSDVRAITVHQAGSHLRADRLLPVYAHVCHGR